MAIQTCLSDYCTLSLTHSLWLPFSRRLSMAFLQFPQHNSLNRWFTNTIKMQSTNCLLKQSTWKCQTIDILASHRALGFAIRLYEINSIFNQFEWEQQPQLRVNKYISYIHIWNASRANRVRQTLKCRSFTSSGFPFINGCHLNEYKCTFKCY